MARLGRGHIRDVSGQQFHHLRAIRYSTERSKAAGDAYWDCACVCGNPKTVRLSHLLSGNIKSCGCRAHDWSHGQTRSGKWSPEYSVWAGILRRCFNPREESYKHYGERGITVCKGWRRFENFFADMGRRPSRQHSIERQNNDAGYWCGHCDECSTLNHPDNCRWATKPEQNRNYRRNHSITYKGETMVLTDWAERYGLPPYLLRQRITRDGWTIERALTTPAKADNVPLFD